MVEQMTVLPRISFAVGHSDLTRTYRKVLDKNKSLSVKVIDAAIRLDHFASLPDKELTELFEKVRKNNFTFTVIRDLVADYLYFYERDFRAMQALGAQWNIKVSAPKFIANRSKR